MTMTDPERRDRRGFKSRTPVLGSDSSRRRPWGFVTRHQVSGWRFQIRRISNGVALLDTQMLTDPLRRQGRALVIGAVLAVLVCAGAFMLSVVRPAGVSGNDVVLADRSSGALYVLVNDQLHPVLNLASARLIVGKAAEPKVVKSSEIDRFPLGNTLGIPNAPARIVQSSDRDARWTVCDTVGGAEPGTTVIVGDPVPGSGHAAALPQSSAVLVSTDGGETVWLVWGNKRSEIDLDNAAVTSAVGINIDTPPARPIDRALLNLIPESPALAVPFIANAGDPPRFVWPGEGTAPVIGSVVIDRGGPNNANRYYAVTAEGLQPISSVVAAILRANDAYGLVEPPALTPDEVAKAPETTAIAVDNYPSEPLTVLDPTAQPVACAQWVKLNGAPTSTLTLLVGQSLPIAQDAAPVALASPGPTTAQRVVMPKGIGYFVQVTGQQPESVTKESLFWVSDLGVRYGLETAENETTAPSAALGMTSDPLPVPWSVLSLYAPGPTLSKSDALVAH